MCHEQLFCGINMAQVVVLFYPAVVFRSQLAVLCVEWLCYTRGDWFTYYWGYSTAC